MAFDLKRKSYAMNGTESFWKKRRKGYNKIFPFIPIRSGDWTAKSGNVEMKSGKRCRSAEGDKRKKW
jgi:hypothetical protein